MDRGIEQPLPPALGGLAIPWVFCDVGNHPRIDDHLPIAGGIKAAIEVEVSSTEIYTDLFGHLFQRFQALG